MAPLPGRSDWPLRLHTFFNMGQLSQLSSCTFGTLILVRLKHLGGFSELLQPSASAGVGLLFQQGPVRLELNFGVPLLARIGDGTRKGLQFGIGLDFL